MSRTVLAAFASLVSSGLAFTHAQAFPSVDPSVLQAAIEQTSNVTQARYYGARGVGVGYGARYGYRGVGVGYGARYGYRGYGYAGGYGYRYAYPRYGYAASYGYRYAYPSYGYSNYGYSYPSYGYASYATYAPAYYSLPSLYYCWPW